MHLDLDLKATRLLLLIISEYISPSFDLAYIHTVSI